MLGTINSMALISAYAYSNANIKKISIDYGYSTEGKLVYINELPDTPFILAVEPTTQMKYLISIVPTDTDLFDVVKIGETIRIYHTYPITAQTITILSDAQAYSMGNGGAGLTVEDKAFIEAKGYTVKE